MSVTELLIGVSGNPSLYRLHELVYARFAGNGERSFVFTPIELPRTRAVLVRGDVGGTPLPALAMGEERDFSLRALVTVKSRSDDRRRPLARQRADERLAWLDRRAEANGFVVLHAEVEVRREPLDKPGHNGWFDASGFHGRLRVADADRFMRALANGIGKGRAFGFGMIVLY